VGEEPPGGDIGDIGEQDGELALRATSIPPFLIPPSLRL